MHEVKPRSFSPLSHLEKYFFLSLFHCEDEGGDSRVTAMSMITKVEISKKDESDYNNDNCDCWKLVTIDQYFILPLLFKESSRIEKDRLTWPLTIGLKPRHSHKFFGCLLLPWGRTTTYL